jgi:hypothetical protein
VRATGVSSPRSINQTSNQVRRCFLTEEQGRTIECTERQGFWRFAQEFDQPSREAQPLAYSVDSIVLPCFSVRKTLTCLIDYSLDCLIAYRRLLRCRSSALVSHRPHSPTPMASKRTVRPRRCAAIRPASASAPGGSHSLKCIAGRSMTRGRDAQTPLDPSPGTVSTSTPRQGARTEGQSFRHLLLLAFLLAHGRSPRGVRLALDPMHPS